MRLVTALVLVGACGGSAGGTIDAATPGDGATDASNSDAPVDVATDAPEMLSPEPPDPVGMPCAGMLGFPNPPGAFTGQGTVRLGRIDNDALLDLVVRTPAGFGVAHGNGDGSFAPFTISTPFPGNEGEFLVADVDGDARGDLVFVTDDFLGIEILHGTTVGTFGTPQNLPVPRNVNRVQVADLDGNGRLDLVALASSSGEAVILLATATGFAAPAVHVVGEQNTTQLEIGDVTGDSRPELVGVNPFANTVTVSINRGDGTFQMRTPYGGGLVSIDGIALGDFDEDGKIDVVGGGYFGSAAHVVMMRNDGAGGFPTTVRFPTGTGVASANIVRVADFDGDGHRDVFAAAAGNASFAVLRGTGTGQLGAPVLVDAIDDVPAVQLADVNADNRIDVLLESSSRPVFLNNATAMLFDSRRTVALSIGVKLWGARLLDLGLDGLRDVVAFGDENAGMSLVLTRIALAGGGYAAQSMMPAPQFSGWAISTDLDNDTRADLLVVGGETRAFLNRGTGALVPAGAITGQWYPIAGAIADLDGDHLRDVLVEKQTGLNTHDIAFARGLGAGQLAAPTVVATVARLVGAALLDLDADGQLDLVAEDLTQTLQARRIVRRGLGGGTFAAPTMVDMPIAASLRARDVNKDGKTDLIGFAVGNVYVSLGMGGGALAPPIVSPSASFTDIVFADIDGDGNLDLVGTTGPSDIVYVVRGRGDGTFAPPLPYPSARARSVQVVDTDADGRLDLVLDDPLGNLTILPGRCR